MNPILKRRLKILGYMSLYGLLWGAVAGGVAGMMVGVFAFLIGALFGLPYGAFLGAQVGLAVGFICGLITLWFEMNMAEVTQSYWKTVVGASLITTPIMIYLRMIGFALPTANTKWIFILPVMTFGTLFAFFVSRKLVKEYNKRFVE